MHGDGYRTHIYSIMGVFMGWGHWVQTITMNPFLLLKSKRHKNMENLWKNQNPRKPFSTSVPITAWKLEVKRRTKAEQLKTDHRKISGCTSTHGIRRDINLPKNVQKILTTYRFIRHLLPLLPRLLGQLRDTESRMRFLQFSPVVVKPQEVRTLWSLWSVGILLLFRFLWWCLQRLLMQLKNNYI